MSELGRPRISVVIPCYNQGGFLDDSVSSCVEAYRGPLQIVVIDDGSTDPAISGQLGALRVPERVELVIFRQENRGLSGARNAGLERCTGELVQFLDSDDLLVREKLEHQVRHLRADPQADVSVSDYWLANSDRSEVRPSSPSLSRFELSLDEFLYQWERGFIVPIHAALFRRAVLGTGALFCEEARGKEDWRMWVRLLLDGARLSLLPLRLCVYRLHEQAMTRSGIAMGVEFLKAAKQIDRWLGGRRPDFMQRSVSWFAEYYANLPVPSAQPAPEPSPPAPLPPVPRPAGPLAPRDESRAACITVVVPVHDHQRFLRRCLLSARDQTCPPGEILCIDDCSHDPSVRPTLESLAAEIPQLRLELLDENRGIAAVQNLAVELARGEFLAFLDCDDFLAPEALEVVSDAMRDHPGADYYFTDRLDVDEQEGVLRRAEYGGYEDGRAPDREAHYENLLDAMIATHLKVVRRSSIRKVGGFDPETSGVQDWDLALKIAEQGRIHYVPRAVYHHRIHPGSVTQSRRVAMFRLTNEVRRRHQGVRTGREVSRAATPAEVTGVAELLASGPREGVSAGPFEWCSQEGLWRDRERGAVLLRRVVPPREAWRLWSGASRCVFAIPRGATPATLAFLREFNSYFDLVLCADSGQWSVLHRYTWNPEVLRLASELPPAR
jgi:glycosyltransferase involved in cell wall biosynthesis